MLESLPDAPIVVIEGVRSPAEVGLFRRYFGRVALVAIHASPRTRYLRLLKRGRQDDPRTWDEFVQRDKRELSLGIGEVIALADYMLVNEGMSRDEFLERCAEALRRILRDLST